MQVQQINNYSQNYNPNFTAIKNIKYKGLFKKLKFCWEDEYKTTILTSLNNIPEFMTYCKDHDVDLVLDTKVKDYIKPNTVWSETGHDISIILKIVYERLKPNKSSAGFLNKNVEQKVIVEQTYEQEGSFLSERIIDKFVEFINGQGRDSFIRKLKNADLEILKETNPKAYKEKSEQIARAHQESLEQSIKTTDSSEAANKLIEGTKKK